MITKGRVKQILNKIELGGGHLRQNNHHSKSPKDTGRRTREPVSPKSTASSQNYSTLNSARIVSEFNEKKQCPIVPPKVQVQFNNQVEEVKTLSGVQVTSVRQLSSVVNSTKTKFTKASKSNRVQHQSDPFKSEAIFSDDNLE